MFHFRQKIYSASAFNTQMQHVFGENASFIRNVVISSYQEQSEKLDHQQHLLNNQTALGELVSYFDPEKSKITLQFTNFIKLLFDAVYIFKYKINIPQFRTHWHEQADNLVALLHAMNEWNVRVYFYKQIQIIEIMIASAIKNETAGQEFHYKCLYNNNYQLAQILANGIISANSSKFR